jgi:polyhydroxybutyrate depolymerase
MRTARRLASIATGFVVIGGVTACAAGRGTVASDGRQTLIHDGVDRSYVVRAPASLAQRAGRVPLVIVLHGGGGDAANAERMTGFTAKAETEGFIVVYPEGTSRLRGRLLTWNAGHCCGYAMENRVRDVEFIGALMDTLIARYPVDPARVYATGMSNGGMMAHRLGIALSGRLAAIAPVVATVFGDERTPEQPVSAIMVNGVLDRAVPPAGGPPGGRFTGAWDGTPARPALDQAAFWARAAGCSGPPETRDESAATVTRYRCAAGRAVELHLVKDNGHAWPGGQQGSRMGDPPNPSFDATAVIWSFFARHAK